MFTQQNAIANANNTYTIFDTVGTNVSLKFYDLSQTAVYTSKDRNGFDRTQLITSGTPTIGVSNDPTSGEFGNIIFGKTTPAEAFAAAVEIFAGNNTGSGLTPPLPILPSYASSETQISINLLPNIPQVYVIPSTTRLITFCTTGQDLVYYTSDGTTPTTNNAWFYSFGKETWDNNIPVGLAMKFISATANQLAIVVRY